MLRGGKRQFGGKVAYAGSIRSRQALVCCHGALARSLASDYTLNRKPFPSPADLEVWLEKSPLWQGGSGEQSISYTQHYDCLKGYFEEAGVHIRKVTHAWRLFKARDLDEQGVEDKVRVVAGYGLHSGQRRCVAVCVLHVATLVRPLT